MANDLTTSIDAGRAALIVTLPDGTTETYPIDQPPAADSALVRGAKQEVLNDLDLHEMLGSLSRVVDLLHLAYCGVAGTAIQADLSDRRKTFLELCSECARAMQRFRDCAKNVSNNVADAFHYIADAQEKRAMSVLTRAANSATEMAATSGKLAARFRSLGDEVQESHHATIEAVAVEETRLAELRRLQAEMTALLAGQTKANEELATSIAALQAQYVDAKSREERESERAFITGIVSSVTGALGSAFGAYAAAKNPVGAAAANAAANRRDEKPGKAAEDEAAGTPGADSNSVAASIREEKMRLLDKKLEQEAEKRAAVAKMAELTARIGSTTEEEGLHEASQDALQLAVWAFANITTTLVLAGHFWSNVAAACGRLAESDIRVRIDEEIESGDDPEARRAFYRSRMFLPSAVGYLARWRAMWALGDEYTAAANDAFTRAGRRISEAPDIATARNLVEPLKRSLAAQFEAEQAASELRAANVREELELLEAVD